MSNKYIENVRVLLDISTIVQSDMELAEKFTQALERVRDISGAHFVSLFIHDEESGRLEEVATLGARVDLIESINFDMGMGFSAWVAKQRRSVLIPTLRGERSDGARSFISTPLVSGDTLIGVMNLGHSEPNAFTEENLELLDLISAQFAFAIERSNYEQELRLKNEALESARREIVEQQKKLIDMEKFQVIGQMAASLNHEINNPLTSILGNLELLFMLKPDMDDMLKKKLTVIQNESKRISGIIEKFRDMKKVVVGDYLEKYNEKMIDLNASVNASSSNEENNSSARNNVQDRN